MPDNYTGGFFANMIYDHSKLDKKKDLNKKLWYVAKNGAYLVLKIFSDDESKWISAGLRDIKTFRFSDNGNIACVKSDGKQFTYKNVLDTNSVVRRRGDRRTPIFYFVRLPPLLMSTHFQRTTNSSSVSR